VASLRRRPGWQKPTIAWAALTGPTPKRLVRPENDVIDDGRPLGAVVVELLPGLAQGQCRATDLGLADSMLRPRTRKEMATRDAGRIS
jgi:hypothetical protein